MIKKVLLLPWGERHAGDQIRNDIFHVGSLPKGTLISSTDTDAKEEPWSAESWEGFFAERYWRSMVCQRRRAELRMPGTAQAKGELRLWGDRHWLGELLGGKMRLAHEKTGRHCSSEFGGQQSGEPWPVLQRLIL